MFYFTPKSEKNCDMDGQSPNTESPDSGEGIQFHDLKMILVICIF